MLNSGESGHIKATLLQFLRSCPLTERNNEQLLSIVMNMMEFSKEEIGELSEARNVARHSGSAANAGKGPRANSVSSGGAPGGHYGVGTTDTGEDELKKKTSKGIFGMFSRKGSSQRRDGNSNDNSQNITSPGKPMMPIGRR